VADVAPSSNPVVAPPARNVETTLPPAAERPASSPVQSQPIAPPQVAKADGLERQPAPATSPAKPIVSEPSRIGQGAMNEQERDRALKMLLRGERELHNGNVSAARQFFLRAAEAGLPIGAFSLASTYDAHELNGLRILGVQPNHAIAEKWYKRADELGAHLAKERLARLGVVD
jgi:TPR repeat protein